MRILLFTLILITASAQLVLATSQSLISLLIALLTELSALIGALITYTVIRRSHNNLVRFKSIISRPICSGLGSFFSRLDTSPLTHHPTICYHVPT